MAVTLWNAFLELFTESDEELSSTAENIGTFLVIFVIGMLMMIIDTWA